MGRTFRRMHLADFMTANNLSDEDVATAVGRSRVSISRYRRGLMRPNWQAVDDIKSFTKGEVSADDWCSPPADSEARELQPEAAQ